MIYCVEKYKEPCIIKFENRINFPSRDNLLSMFVLNHVSHFAARLAETDDVSLGSLRLEETAEIQNKSNCEPFCPMQGNP